MFELMFRSMHAAAVLVYSAHSVASLYIAYRNQGQGTKPQAWHPEESQAVLRKGQEKELEVLGKGHALGKEHQALGKGQGQGQGQGSAAD